MSSREEQKAEARRVRQEREAAAAAAAARTRRLRLLGTVLAAAAAIVVVAVVISSGQGGKAPKPHPGERIAGQAAAAAEFGGITQRGESLGDPKAKMVLIEYGDLICPFCKEYSDQIVPTVVQNYVRPGKVRMVLRLFGYIRPYSTPAARYAWAAGEQNKLWAFAKLWYTNQGDENTDYVSDAFARRIASGVPGLDADAMLAASGSAAVKAKIAAAAQGFRAAGAPGTPTFTIGPRGGTQHVIDLGSSPSSASAAIDKAIAAG